MGRSITPLKDQLAQAGISVTKGDGEPALETPWFVRLDEQCVAHFQRLDSGEEALSADEKRLRYRLRNGRVRFATDAFFFQEGHAERYEPARYGLFRVNERGEPLLVALHGAELELLGEIER